MTILILGLLIWSAAHLFKRIMSQQRAAWGDRAKGAIAIAVLFSLILMIIGYRSAEGTFYWGRTPAMVGVNNLLMLLSIYLFAASGMKTSIARKIRHPMLTGTLLWCIAHLLVNGDTPSFVLFGGIALWSILSIVLINRAEPLWTPPAAKPAKFEAMAVAGTLIVYGLGAGVHYALGYPAFG